MKKKIIVVIILFLFQSIIANLGHPVTPAFVRALGLKDYMFGIFYTLMSLGLMIGSPIWGMLGDKFPKRPLIVGGLLLYSCGQWLFGYSGDVVWMGIARFLSGLGASSVMTLFTSYLVAHSDPEKRSKNLGYMGAAVTLGASIGYYLGGFISTNPWVTSVLNIHDYRQIFLVQTIVNTIFALAVVCFFRDNVSKKNHEQAIVGAPAAHSHQPLSLILFLLSLTFFTIGATNISKFLDVYFNDLGYSPEALGTFVFFTGITSIVTSVAIVPLLARIRRQILLMMAVQILGALIIFIVFRLNHFIFVIYSVFMIYIALKAIYQPLEQSYISRHVRSGKYATLLGWRQAFVSIGMVLGPLGGGFLYEKSPLILFDSSGLFFLIGALMLAGVYILKRTKNRHIGRLE
jgi:DHA1 family multidrug resistance protein-like MFS transporter